MKKKQGFSILALTMILLFGGGTTVSAACNRDSAVTNFRDLTTCSFSASNASGRNGGAH